MLKPFQFKQFSVNQNQCAMKIGTDGVLLGAWTSIESNPYSILDIGAGTGVLSLMLAQRGHAEVIEALEIDDNAYEQCVENFEQSPWNDRLFCYHASLEEFTEEIEDKYDLIICNPPFYLSSIVSDISSKGGKKTDHSRQMARFQDAMPFDHLLESVANLLAEEGSFSVVIPFSEEHKFIALAAQVALFPKQILHVRGNPSVDIKRSLIEFSFLKQDVEIPTAIGTELIIETSRHQYTEDYTNLTKDFYLKM